MDLNVKGAKTTSIAEGTYSIPVNAQNVGTKLPPQVARFSTK